MLPQEARGIYREMLTQAWRRGARLPNDHAMIRRATGTTPEEWDRAWPLIARYWREVDDWIVNETQQEVYHEALGVQQRASKRGKNGAKARSLSTAQAVLEQQPPSPSPTDVLIDQERQVRAGALSGFDSFWSVYPKKKSRSDAEKAWRKLAPSPELTQQILDAVAAQLDTPDWTKDAGRYIPYPATWLNGQRWNDVVQAPTRASPARKDWWEECKELHGGTCTKRWDHETRLIAERRDAEGNPP